MTKSSNPFMASVMQLIRERRKRFKSALAQATIEDRPYKDRPHPYRRGSRAGRKRRIASIPGKNTTNTTINESNKT